MAVTHKKRVQSGRIKTWEPDRDAIARVARWSARRRDLLATELSEMAQHFPPFFTTLGRLIEAGFPWGEVVLCPGCSDAIIFDRGVRCASCGQPLRPMPTDPLLCFSGRIAAALDGRPVAERMLRVARAFGEKRSVRAQEAASYVMRIQDRLYFAPKTYCYLPPNWPRSKPYTVVNPAYFEYLGLPPDHIYPDTNYRLCNYANWHEVTLREVLQQRIVPRIHIDLILADLRVKGILDEVLDQLDVSHHEIYNVIGKPNHSEEVLSALRRHL